MKPIETHKAPGLTVTFDPNVCAHSAVCTRSLPAVFNVDRKEWIQPGAASIAEITSVIDRCPSGALQYTREADPAAVNPAPKAQAATIRLALNGPLKVEGDFELIDENGAIITHSGRVSLCRCGGTQKQPLCDGAHKSNGFCSRREPAA